MTKFKSLSFSVVLARLPFSISAADIEKINTDIVVVGSGGTGLSAAASAHQHGAKVLLMEKLAFIGGSSALAGGETANRPFYRRVYTSGTGLGLAYTSDRIAGENAAMEK